MTITISASTLAGALKSAAAIVDIKNTLPILSMVRLTATPALSQPKKKKVPATLQITTSNLDIEYRQMLPADIDEAMDFCVDAKRLLAMASAAKGNLEIYAENYGVITIKAGRSRWEAPVLPATDFPVMSVDKLSPPMEVDPRSLATIVRRTIWAVDESRYYLAGMFMNDEGGKARYVTTDGKVATSIETEAAWPADAPNVIIPTKLANVIAEACADADAATPDVKLEWDAAKLRFSYAGYDECGPITITGKMVDGNFPDYRRIFPKDPVEPYAVGTEELRDAIRRVRIASDAKERKLRVARKDGGLAIRIEGTSGFEGAEEIPADCQDGFEAGFNADLFDKMLGAIDHETMAVEHAGPMDVALVRPMSQPAGMKFLGLVMTMRI